jgi:hypothetical protein
MAEPRKPFQEIPAKTKIGLKLDNKNSSVETPKRVSTEEFENKAVEVSNQLDAYSVRAVELSQKYKQVLEDQTLVENKTKFNVDAEKELIANLVQLGIDLNLDEHEKEGMGSIGLIMLLLRAMLIQRDKINSLDFALTNLERKIILGPLDSQKK